MLKPCFADLSPFASRNPLSFFLYRTESAAVEVRRAEPLLVLGLSFVPALV